MHIPAVICKAINSMVPKPTHPFNLAAGGCSSYSEWQFGRGYLALEHYKRMADERQMLEGKTVLDIGCGAGGKTVYYATFNPRHIYGIDLSEGLIAEASEFAEKKGLQNKVTFKIEDASRLSFEDNFFDSIIMNDAVEHLDDPVAVLNECYRVLKQGGRLYTNFPPYYHPYGAHLSDVIGIPWVHMFFSEKTLIRVYKDLVSGLPDAQMRIDYRIGTAADGKEYFTHINKMTIRRFESIKRTLPFKTSYYYHVPLRGFLSLPSKIPLLREVFVKMVVCIFEK
ncbi:MAG: class I SAM-dependent methyltransferase [Clostridiales bacterium]|jgi:ubiquinone/menaquinone biosynthesis C-methylase UbiE|nr:class I SAM-dependent methyltransferase [Eubacteriales bacterium]MDH7566135.1 class I SAM-dependent methyltransferase [Clostridiales bacterium]